MMQAPGATEAADALASIAVFKNEQTSAPQSYRYSRKHLTQAPVVLVAKYLVNGGGEPWGSNHLGHVLGHTRFRARLQPSCRGAGTSCFEAYSPITLVQQTHWQH